METNELIKLVSCGGREEKLKCNDLREKSHYFRALFDSGMKEVQEGKVILPTISNEALEKIAEFVKSGCLDLSDFMLNETEELLEATAYLHMPEAGKICAGQLLRILTVENCDSIINIARRNADSELETQVQDFRNQNIQTYVQTSQFKKMSFDEMCQLLSSNFIAISEEIQIWKFIIIWLQGNKEEVERVFNQSEYYEEACIRLLNVLRFPCIGEDKSPLDNNSMLILQDVFQQHVLDTFLKLYIKESQFARKYHNDTTMYHKQTQVSKSKFEIRNPVDVIIAIGGFTSREYASKMTCLLPITELLLKRKVETLLASDSKDTTRELRSRSQHSSDTNEQSSPAQPSDEADIRPSVGEGADPSQRQPSQAPEAPITESTSSHTTTSGSTSSQTTTSSSDPNNRVEFKTQMKFKLPTNLCENGICVVDGVLYIAGGQVRYNEDGRHTTNAVHRFDPWRCQWSQVSSMRVKRSLFYLGEVGGKLYAVCGWVEPNKVTRTVEVYDPKLDRWSFASHLEDRPHEHAGCNHKGSMYVSGGFKGPFRGHLDKLWRYDVADDTWTTLAPMLMGRSYHSMVSVGENILIAGGVNYVGRDTFMDVRNCELYNSETNQWSYITTCPMYASCHASLFHSHKLFLFGGHSFREDSDHDVIQVLDTTKWSWEKLVMSGHKAKFFSCAMITLPKHML